MRAASPAHLILLELITLIIFDEEYKYWKKYNKTDSSSASQ
jgi:hypothetical protein